MGGNSTSRPAVRMEVLGGLRRRAGRGLGMSGIFGIKLRFRTGGPCGGSGVWNMDPMISCFLLVDGQSAQMGRWGCHYKVLLPYLLACLKNNGSIPDIEQARDWKSPANNPFCGSNLRRFPSYIRSARLAVWESFWAMTR